MAADDVCVDAPTRQLVAEHYRHISDLRSSLDGQQGLVSCAKLKRMLGWQPQYHWRKMAAESETRGFPTSIPSR